jgi:Tfp pilus assembly protein PilF
MSHRHSLLPRLSALVIYAALGLAATLPAQDFSDATPASQAPLIQKANDALAAGDFHGALTILTSLNTQNPKNPEILYDLGLTLEALNSGPTTAGQPALTAESCYRKAIEANPRFAPPQIALGLLLARTGHPVDAHAQLTTAIAIPDIDPALKARALRALARLDQQATPPNPDAASDELLSALKLTPEHPDDILLSAEIATSSNDLPSAEQAYRRYLAMPANSGDTQAVAALAHVLLEEHHPAEAESLLTPALTQHSNDPAFTAQLAEAYLDSGDPAKAARAAPLLESLHAARPDETSITRLLARIYLDSGHPEQAAPLYSSLIAASAEHPDPTLLDDQAEVLLRQHRPAEAEKLLKQAVADPAAFPTPAAFGDAATHLAFAASEIDDPRTTLQALSLRAKVQPPSPSSLFLEATANDALHQSSKAVDLYKQFLAAANGNLPDQESQARQRLAELTHKK